MKQILFWSSYSNEDTLKEWMQTKVELFPSHKLSLKSHEKLGNEVHIYSYQNIITPVPENVIWKDASEFYEPKYAYSALQRGHSIAHISDLIRFAAAASNAGAIMDMD